MTKRMRCLFAALAATLFAGAASADVITNGFTFAVADDFQGASFIGTHYHSNTGGAFGNPAGKAEVGGFFGTEEVRGLSEYNLAGLTTAGPAFVTFNVFLMNGLFNQGGGAFQIDVYAYTGNNQEDLSDWQAPATALIGSFNTGGLLVGQVLSFDVNAALDAALLAGDTSFGIRLQQRTRDIGGPAYTFDSFRLTTTNEGAVPEPGSLLLLATGLLAFGAVRRRYAV